MRKAGIREPARRFLQRFVLKSAALLASRLHAAGVRPIFGR
jgi:hypothetical protein